MRKVLIISVIGLISVAGCKQSIREDATVAVDLNVIDKDSIPYSMFVDSITYLSLDPDNNCLIGEISNVAFLDSCIVVFESKTSQVHLMNRDGKFLRDIGGRGAGHGEFIYPVQMDIDEDNKLILIYDIPQSAVMKYNLDNVYVGRDSIGHASDMAYLGDGRYLTTNYNDIADKSGVFIIDTKTGHAEKMSDCRDNVPMKKPWEIFRNGGQPAVMTRPYEDKVMEWNGNELTLFQNFNVVPSPDKQDLSVIENHPQEKLKYPDRMIFLKSDRWFYSYYWLDNKIRYIFWDDKTHEMTVTPSLFNDIDSVYGSELPLCVNNSFVRVVEGNNENENPRLQFLHLKR